MKENYILYIVSTVFSKLYLYKYCVILNADGLNPHLFLTIAHLEGYIFHTPLSNPQPPGARQSNQTHGKLELASLYFSTSATQ